MTLSNKLQGKETDLRKDWWREKTVWKILQSLLNSKNTIKFSDQGSRRQQADIAYDKDGKWIWITATPWIPRFRSATEIGPTLRPKATPHCGFKKKKNIYSQNMLNEFIFNAIICVLLIYILWFIYYFLEQWHLEIEFVNPELSYVFWNCCLPKASLSK